jgi:hypothetical protein
MIHQMSMSMTLNCSVHYHFGAWIVGKPEIIQPGGRLRPGIAE